MSSRSKNFRRRPDSAVAEDDNPPSPAPKPQSLPKKPRIVSAPSRLSFADDDDNADDAPPRPAAPPRTKPHAPDKVTFTKHRTAAPAASVFSNVQPQAGEYTKERLRELQKNARSLGSSVHKSAPEPVIVLKGVLKPDANAPALPAAAAVPVPPVPVEDDENGRGSERGAIPDQAMIDAIRAKREWMRKSRGPAAEYISLDGSGVVSSRRGGGGSSDEEDVEFRGRIALFGDKDGAGKKGVFEDVDERMPITVVDTQVASVMEEDEEDEEERKWEEEQFRKALGKRIDVPVLPQPSVYSEVAHQQPSSSSLPSVPCFTATAAWNSGAMSILEDSAAALQAFFDTRDRHVEKEERTKATTKRIGDDILELADTVTAMETSLAETDVKYIFMQKFRDYIAALCEFLKEKAALIDELEECMQKLHEERASAVEDRRDADIADEQSELGAAVSAAMSVLGKGSGSAFISAATTAAQAAAAAAKESFNLPPQLDEYGRDINQQKRTDYFRRAESRKRKRSQSDSKRMLFVEKNNEYKYIEGELSTDESDSESRPYQSTRDELLKVAGQIFRDASEEFSNLSKVKDQFESCKKEYPSVYRDAYFSLSVPDIFSPFVRLELLNWDPLYSKTLFGDMEWHNILIDYGLPGEGQSLNPDDADDKLVPELVEKVALPILHHEIEHCWDVLSTQRTEHAVFAADMIMSYVPLDSKALHELLAVVCSRLTKAVTTLDVPTWSPVVIKAVPGAAQYAVYKFGTSLRLLKNICLWKGLLPLPVLEKLALEELLIGKLLPHVRSSMSNIHDAITKIHRVVASLSGVWYGSNVQGVRSQKLQPLVECVSELGRKLEKRHAAGVSEEETNMLVRRLKTMLVELDERERARAMLKTFQLKEAL